MELDITPDDAQAGPRAHPGARPRLGDMLLEAGVINPTELRLAIARQAEPGAKRARLGAVIVEMGFATEDAIARTLARQLDLPYVDLTTVVADPDLMSLVPRRLADKHLLVPVRRTENGLTIATADPTNVVGIDDVRTASGGAEVSLAVSTITAVREAIDRIYAVDLAATDLLKRFGVASEIDVRPEGTTDEDDEVSVRKSAQSAPIVRLVNALFADAVRSRATDVHIEPQPRELKVRYRVDGLLREVMTFPKEMQALIVSRIKIISGMDIAERRRPQDGAARIAVSGKDIDARASTIPTLSGEKVVVRLLDKTAQTISMPKLGLDPDDLASLESHLAVPQGLIVFCGPTGAGKSSTMYSALTSIQSIEKNIVTLEDPIEYQVPGLNQMSINEKGGVTFAKGLRSILRQDPDVIMVGEIRDAETANMVIQSALTGHLVLSSLHTNNAFAAVTRLVDLGVEPFRIASALTLAIAQRLVRVICDNCVQPADPSERTMQLLGLTPGDLAGAKLSHGVGCERCNFTGYRGRTGIYEVLPITQSLRDQISTQVTETALTQTASGSGAGLRQAGILKAVAGITTLDEVLRVTHVQEVDVARCHSCRQEIDTSFVVCPYCQADLAASDCPGCARAVEPDWEVCPFCRTTLPGHGPSDGKPRVLVVDDDASTRLLLETVLSEDYTVLLARSGEEGVRKATIERPDLILLDLRLGDMLGTEVATRLRATAATSLIPLIMLTGSANVSSEVASLRAGVDDYMTKPFDEPALLARIEAALRRTRRGMTSNRV